MSVGSIKQRMSPRTECLQGALTNVPEQFFPLNIFQWVLKSMTNFWSSCFHWKVLILKTNNLELPYTKQMVHKFSFCRFHDALLSLTSPFLLKFNSQLRQTVLSLLFCLWLRLGGRYWGKWHPWAVRWIDSDILSWGFPGGMVVKNVPAYEREAGLILGQEDPLEEETATHSSIRA